MAAAQEEADLQGLNDCLTVCGLRTVTLRNGIINREGKRSLEEFGQFQPEDIGKNWGVLSYTDVVCEVTPFTDEYDSIKEVPIVTACTVWTDQNTGKEYLLVGEQFLWFGTSLDHSLLEEEES